MGDSHSRPTHYISSSLTNNINMLIGNYIHVFINHHLESKVNLDITVHFSLTEIDGLYILHRQEIPYNIRSHKRPQRHLVMLIAALQTPQVVIFLYASDN